jgi:hypothetical protein
MCRAAEPAREARAWAARTRSGLIHLNMMVPLLSPVAREDEMNPALSV